MENATGWSDSLDTIEDLRLGVSKSNLNFLCKVVSLGHTKNVLYRLPWKHLGISTPGSEKKKNRNQTVMVESVAQTEGTQTERPQNVQHGQTLGHLH